MARPPSAPVATVERCALHEAGATPASECTFHRNYVCPSVPTQNGRDGLVASGGPPNLLCSVSRSQSRTSMKDARPWKLYMPPGVCGNVMYVCHSIRGTDCDNADNAQLAAVDR